MRVHVTRSHDPAGRLRLLLFIEDQAGPSVFLNWRPSDKRYLARQTERRLPS